MINVTQLPSRELDLPMEVLGVLRRQAEPTVHEIAHDIAMNHRYQMDSAAFAVALKRLRDLGYVIREHPDVDGVRYELVQENGV